MKNTFKLALVSSLMLAGSTAQANIEWSGFANIGAGFTTGSDEQALGYSDSLRFEPDTLFALQGRANLSDDLSITTQLMSRGDDNFSLGIEWAYLQYQINEAWNINAGKLRLPFYSYSDSLDVAYSYHWLRPPQAVYRVPFSNYTGVSVQNNLFIGDVLINSQFIVGSLSDDMTFAGADADADVEDIVGISASVNYHNWALRGGYFHSGSTTLTIHDPQFNGLLGALFNAGFANTAIDLMVHEQRTTFSSVGLTFDNFDWVFTSEYTVLDVEDSFLAKQRSFYLSLGKRIGNWTPHITYAGTRDQAASIETSALPEPLNTAVHSFVSGNAQRSNMTSVGVRYDLRPGVALKFDLTHVDDKAFDNRSNVVSFAVQTVF